MDDRASTRPKRQVHPPSYYDEYEMGFILPQRQVAEARIRRHGQEEELHSQIGGAATMKPIMFTHHQSPRDADYTEVQHIATREYSQGPGSGFQLAHSYTESPQAERSRVSTPHSWSAVQYILPPVSPKVSLQSRDEHLDAMLAEIRETRSELRSLAQAVRNLKQTPEPATVCAQSNPFNPRKSDQFPVLPSELEFLPPLCEELVTNMQGDEYDDADWPDPPPWPEREDPQPQLVSGEPIVDLLDKMMSELQVLKQAAVSQSRPLVTHARSPTIGPIITRGPPTAKTSRMLPGHSSQQQGFHHQTPLQANPAYNSEQYHSHLQASTAIKAEVGLE
ncbi:hypothetical protein KOW79_011012 [Hemibagrus wyckioides]|uniref:Uncharacterized protein n=1 Tax=Hemibagrus wyckioides TaxID=337641 RepID=A0A9D3NSF6_9TELE|nr:hypothetical protein KOW79_011012 [Hemibagrus wyckioides]